MPRLKNLQERAYNFISLFSNDIGIDLGTANTLVYVKGQGIILNEPSVVAMEKRSGKVLAIGIENRIEIIGKTAGNLVYPFFRQVI